LPAGALRAKDKRAADAALQFYFARLLKCSFKSLKSLKAIKIIARGEAAGENPGLLSLSPSETLKASKIIDYFIWTLFI
jgi:hypothetical protein